MCRVLSEEEERGNRQEARAYDATLTAPEAGGPVFSHEATPKGLAKRIRSRSVRQASRVAIRRYRKVAKSPYGEEALPLVRLTLRDGRPVAHPVTRMQHDAIARR